MQEIVSIFLIGISLSMDTFSLSLSVASIIKDSKYINILPIVVGIFHFFMPLLGNIIGIKVIEILDLASNVILGLILIILGINLFVHYFKDEELNFNLSIIGTLLFALSVSIDSFSVGLGISNITTNYLLASLVFAVCSFSFTYMGLILGKYSNNYLGKYASIIGIILLLFLGFYHLFV